MFLNRNKEGVYTLIAKEKECETFADNHWIDCVVPISGGKYVVAASFTFHDDIEKISKEECDKLSGFGVIPEIQSELTEVEFDLMLQVRHGVEWYNLPNQKEGRDPEGIYRSIPNKDEYGNLILKLKR